MVGISVGAMIAVGDNVAVAVGCGEQLESNMLNAVRIIQMGIQVRLFLGIILFLL
jgi:hypothetical protein